MPSDPTPTPFACVALLTRGPRIGITATGTQAGYQRHRQAGEPACALCLRAARDATRRRRAPQGGPTLGPGEHAAAAAATIAEQVRTGRVGPVDAPQVATALELAELADSYPTNWRVWLLALTHDPARLGDETP